MNKKRSRKQGGDLGKGTLEEDTHRGGQQPATFYLNLSKEVLMPPQNTSSANQPLGFHQQRFTNRFSTHRRLAPCSKG